MSCVKEYPLSRARRGFLPFALLGGLFASGCTSSDSVVRDRFPGLEAAPTPARSGPENDEVVATVDGRAVTLADLRPALLEAAGALALEEAILDRALDRELASAGLKLTEADMQRERDVLGEALRRDARADANGAERLIEGLRRSRGLGEARFAAQLARTAKLRRLVAGTVNVSDDELRTAHEMRHGLAYRTRVIVTPTEREAAKIWSELNQPGTGDLSTRFAEAAMKESKDPSAPRGGLLGPVSPSDPTYPAAVRSLLETQAPGTISPAVGLERGFALVLVEERIEGDGTTLEQSGPALREELTRRRERLAMDDLARRLLVGARVVVQDRNLRWSWESRRSAP